MEEQRTLAALDIDLQPYPVGAREIVFTTSDGSGNPLRAAANEEPGEFAKLCDYLAAVAADPATPPGERGFGNPDQPRVLIGYDGQEAGGYRIHCTVIYNPNSDDPQIVVSRAVASTASVARLADGLNGINAAGQGIYKWTVAD